MANICETDYVFTGSEKVIRELLKYYEDTFSKEEIIECSDIPKVEKIKDDECKITFWTITKGTPNHAHILNFLNSKGYDEDYDYSYFAFEPGCGICDDYNLCYPKAKYKVEIDCENLDLINSEEELLQTVLEWNKDLFEDGTLNMKEIKTLGYDNAVNVFNLIEYLNNMGDCIKVWVIQHKDNDIFA